MIKTSVIFPTRNEEMLIKEAILDVVRHLKKKKYPFEILVVINGSEDKTEDIVKQISKKNKEVKILKSKPGYGFALRKGLENTKGEYVVIFNVDFYDLRLLDLVDIDLYGRDFIIGSKLTPWSKDFRSLSRKFISKAFNLLLKVMFGFKGSDTHGIKIMKINVIKKILKDCQTTSGIFDSEFVIKAQRNGFLFSDYPVEVVEKRPPRFSQRLTQTPVDILDLAKSLSK